MKRSIFRAALWLSFALLLTALGISIFGNAGSAGPLYILFFVLLAIGFQGHPMLKGFSYTVIIFAAVTTALFYPQYFIAAGGFKFAVLISPLIQVIMFGMGTSMSFHDFVGVVKMPKGVLIGVSSHFIIMPLIGFTLASVSGFQPEIAAGIILIGCSPNGMASNVISYLAKANLALSVTITAISTMLAPLLTPLLMNLLAGAFIKINVTDMMSDIFKMVIIPIVAGLIFNRLTRGKAAWVDKVMPLISMAGIAFIIVIITAAGRDSLLNIGPQLVLLVLLHNLSGYTLGYWSGRLFKMSEKDCRTIAIEVGMQNGGLASGLAKAMGKIATVGLAPAIFGPLMNVTGSILASYWHRKPPVDKPPVSKAVKVGICFMAVFLVTSRLQAQQIVMPKDQLITLTARWKGERYADGRPKVSDSLIRRLANISLEDAWQYLQNQGYNNQFESGWKIIHPEKTLAGRVVTAQFMPSRPDVDSIIRAKGKAEGRIGASNSWPIDVLQTGDVYVADGFSKVINGTLIGDNLGNSIYAKTHTGVVFDAGVRDLQGLQAIDGFSGFVRGFDPSFLKDVTMTGINYPVRIGRAIALPGDLVLGKEEGIVFIPAHMAEKTIVYCEFIALKDEFGHARLKSGTYTPGQIDASWSEAIRNDFLQWLKDNPSKVPMTKQQLDDLMKERTW